MARRLRSANIAVMELFATRCPWYVAGPLIGLLIVAFYAVANRPLGVLGGYVDAEAFARAPGGGASWRVWMLGGIVVGGLLSALAAGRFAPGFACGSLDQALRGSLLAKAALLGGAGALMGYGARWAGGCTSGHGLCGNATLSPASFAATLTFLATAVAVANLLARVIA